MFTHGQEPWLGLNGSQVEAPTRTSTSGANHKRTNSPWSWSQLRFCTRSIKKGNACRSPKTVLRTSITSCCSAGLRNQTTGPRLWPCASSCWRYVHHQGYLRASFRTAPPGGLEYKPRRLPCRLLQTMPTDMCALEDFDEPDKLHIQVNDVITIIEGRWVCPHVLRRYASAAGFTHRELLPPPQGGELLVARPKQAHPKGRPVPPERGDIGRRPVGARHQPAAEEQLHPHGARRQQPPALLGLP